MPRRLRQKRGSQQPYLTEILRLRLSVARAQASIGYAVARALPTLRGAND